MKKLLLLLPILALGACMNQGQKNEEMKENNMNKQEKMKENNMNNQKETMNETKKILTDEKGMTLYINKNDINGTPSCNGGCLNSRPVYYNPNLSGGDFGVITREDGSKQTTYKGQPLYYYIKDTKTGDMNGNGKGNKWYVVEIK